MNSSPHLGMFVYHCPWRYPQPRRSSLANQSAGKNTIAMDKLISDEIRQAKTIAHASRYGSPRLLMFIRLWRKEQVLVSEAKIDSGKSKFRSEKFPWHFWHVFLLENPDFSETHQGLPWITPVICHPQKLKCSYTPSIPKNHQVSSNNWDDYAPGN